MYENEENNTPDSLLSVVESGILSQEYIQGFAEMRIPKLLIYFKMPFRAVEKGEAWGGPSGTADENIPEGRLIWILGEEPEIIQESEFQKLYGKNL